MSLNALGASSQQPNTLQPSAMEKTFNEISVVLNSNFSEYDKRDAMQHEMRKMLNLPSSAFAEVGEGTLYRATSNVAREILDAYTKYGQNPDLLKQLIFANLQTVQQHPAVQGSAVIAPQQPSVVNQAPGVPMFPENTNTPNTTSPEVQQELQQPVERPKTTAELLQEEIAKNKAMQERLRKLGKIDLLTRPTEIGSYLLEKYKMGRLSDKKDSVALVTRLYNGRGVRRFERYRTQLKKAPTRINEMIQKQQTILNGTAAELRKQQARQKLAVLTALQKDIANKQITSFNTSNILKNAA